MHHDQHIHQHEIIRGAHHKKTISLGIFFERFKKNLSKDVTIILISLKMVILFFYYGVFTFLLGFTIFAKVVDKVKLALFVGIVGVYFTLLPYYIVFGIYFLPEKIRAPLLLLSVIFSFFIVLAI